MMDTIEFYFNRNVFSVRSSMVPPVGSLISIHRVTYIVTRITYALDQANDVFERKLRANVDLEKV